ncbi:unnamed protein product, partial [Polarella glacialis]
IRTLNCAGTAWYDVTLSEARSKEFLQDILAASETGTVQAKIAAARSEAALAVPGSALRRQAEVWASLTHILPEYGLEPSLSVMQERIASALEQVKGLKEADVLRERFQALNNASKPTPIQRVSNGYPAASESRDAVEPVARPSLRAFLLRHKLGPPEGLAEEAVTQAPAEISSSSSSRSAATTSA